MGCALSLVFATRQDVHLSSQSSPPLASPLILDHPAQASSGLILSDQFWIAGTAGSGVCDQINATRFEADRRGLNAGLIHVSFTAISTFASVNKSYQPVNFWILNSSEYSGWRSARTCAARVAAPSILTLLSRSAYDNSTIRIPQTDRYYFAFDNANPTGVWVSLVVDYSPTITTTSTFSKTVLNKEDIVVGTEGSRSSCWYNSYPERLGAGTLTVSYSSTGPVDFWILDQTQYASWLSALGTDCRPRTAQSVFKRYPSSGEIPPYAYDDAIQFKSANTYYFVFVNLNQNPTYVTLTVGSKGEITSSSSTTFTTPSPFNILGLSTSTLQTIAGAVGTGGAAIFGWFFKTRKRRFVSGYLMKVDSTYNEYSMNREECRKRLTHMKNEIIHLLKNGKVDEPHYTLIDNKITEYLKDLGVKPPPSLNQPPKTSQK